MTAKYSANTNTNDASAQDTISIDSTTAVTILPARTAATPIIRAAIFNSGNQTLWLRNYAAATDNLKHGEAILPGGTRILELPNMGIAEWSGIYNSGGARDIYVQYI